MVRCHPHKSISATATITAASAIATKIAADETGITATGTLRCSRLPGTPSGVCQVPLDSRPLLRSE